MPTNQEQVTTYQTDINARATTIYNNRTLMDIKIADIADIDETINTAENSILLDILEARFDVPGQPQYNNLKYTNAESRKAAQRLAMDADADYQQLLADRKLAHAQAKALEAQIEFDRKQFRASELAMQFYATNP